MEDFVNFLKWNFRKSSALHKLYSIEFLFSVFFFSPEQTNSPELCSVPEHPHFYFIVLEDEKLFHSTPTKSVIPSTTQSHRALSPTQCLWLSLSSSASCLSILQAWNLYTSSLLNASLTLTYPESTHIFLYPSHRAGELSLHQGPMEDRRWSLL